MVFPPGKKERPPPPAQEKCPIPQRRQTSPRPLPGLPPSLPVPSAPVGSTLTLQRTHKTTRQLCLEPRPRIALAVENTRPVLLVAVPQCKPACSGWGVLQRMKSYHQTSFSPPPPTAEPELGPGKNRTKCSSLQRGGLSSGPQHACKSFQAPELQGGPGQDQQRKQSSSLTMGSGGNNSREKDLSIAETSSC